MLTEIVRRYIEAQGLNQAEFARSLSEALPEGLGYSQVAINHWLNGRRLPDVARMHYLAANATGWVRSFAVDALAAIDEDVERRR